MNPMIAALRKSRTDVSAPDSSNVDMPHPGRGVGAGMKADLQKYWMMMQDMNSKLDKLMSMMGGNAPDMNSKEEANEPGRGY